MNSLRSLFVAIAAFLPVLFFADSAYANPTDPPPQAEIRVTARQFEFSPKMITVSKGERVKLLVTSEDVDHGIAIDAFNIDVKLPAKQTKTIEFTADREGRFRYYCSVFCGDGHPHMAGELVVTSAQTEAAPEMQVTFVDNEPGVVIVESGGRRMRIDTKTKSVTPVTDEPVQAGERPVVELKERESSKAYEPYDYRVVNIPTPKRVPRGAVNLYFTHRFQQPVRQQDVPIKEEARVLFGLDSFSVSSLGFTYGITDRLYASIYRSPICQRGLCRTIEIGAGYHLLDEKGRSPIALSAYASMEGDDNFTEDYTYNLQVMIARSVTKYVNVFFSPAVHINSNGDGRFNPRPEDFFPPSDAANQFELGQHTGSFGFGVNARIRPSTSLLFEYTPRVGFKLGQTIPIFDSNFNITGFEQESEASIGFGIEKRIGRHAFSLTFSNTQATTTSRYNSSNLVLPPSRFSIGFNLFRRLF
jgi:plastocyanin